MSGVRLDLASLRDESAITERFGVSPPAYPLLDLPFSAALDVFVLGYTVPVALFYQH
ncbi:YceK/YidQ family lipoprotein [Granulosicoccus sp. 3-233]|uniref:YceK/YidQ family lipoprotein n=1 Tax=Granulosicoccus sp. 3-233 TaxID=3417969 RepID=UPI003D3539B4